jgi:hypothetical protein
VVGAATTILTGGALRSRKRGEKVNSDEVTLFFNLFNELRV